MVQTLIIGYGNPLRGDDGLGWRAVQRLEDRWPERAVEGVACHQLVPELAETISRADRVIFIDARVGGEAGRVTVHPLSPGDDPGQSLTHHVSPSSLLALARALYGSHARATLLSVTGASFNHGEALSPAVERALPALVEQVVRLVEGGHLPDEADRSRNDSSPRPLE